MSHPPVQRDLAGVEVCAPEALVLDLDTQELEPQLEGYRRELTGFCRRALGSSFEAEDAVQETLVRAWRGLDRFEGRAALRSWLYRIANNVCIDMLRAKQRRADPVDLGPASTADSYVGVMDAPDLWVRPMPQRRVPSAEGDPAEHAVALESIRSAFVATLLHLPPRQRAVLILREVLRWKADEVAALLGSTVGSVNSALQRARSTIAARSPSITEPAEPIDEGQRNLLARYVDAFERCDVDSLVSLLHPRTSS